jgi:cyanophycinase
MAKNGNGCPVPSGTLMIVGGKENKGEEPKEVQQNGSFVKLDILKTFKELVKKEDPVLEVVTTASSEGDEAFREYKKLFKELGISKTGHIHHQTRKDVLDDSALPERVKNLDAIFFSGGDQLILTSLYGGTGFLHDLKEKYINEPVVIGGTSAGAMALSTPMIYAGNAEVQQFGGEIKITTGLEFLKDVCIDTHFVHRGRFVRMAQVVATNPSCIGIGIEEDTSIIVRNGLEAEVVGSGIVIIIDGLHIERSNIEEFTNKEPVSIRELRVHLLKKGDTYQIPQINPPHK